MDSIRLVPLPGSGPQDLGRLAATLGELFRCAVEVAPPWEEIDFAFEAVRGQYDARALLGALAEREAGRAERVLGLTGCDLFTPVLQFVHGDAQFGGRAAIVSACRLAPEYYGLAPAAAVLQTRLAKRAAHEVGHTLGLFHCPDDRCIMRSSNYVEELDGRPVRFCDECRDQARVRG